MATTAQVVEYAQKHGISRSEAKAILGGSSSSSSGDSSGGGSSGWDSSSSGGTVIPAYEQVNGNFVYNPNNTAGIPNDSNMPVNPQYTSSTGGSSSGGTSQYATDYETGNTYGVTNPSNPIDVTPIPTYDASKLTPSNYGGLIDPNEQSTHDFYGQSSDWGQNETDYMTNYLQFLKDQEFNSFYLQQRKMDIENQLAWAGDANTKAQLEQQLMQINNQMAQSQAELAQRQTEFNQTFGLSQQTQDWTQNYQQQQIDLEKSSQEQEQQNYLARMATDPISWLQYNEAARLPTVSQQFMEGLGGPQAGTVIAGQQYAQPQTNQISQWGGGNLSQINGMSNSPVQGGIGTSDMVGYTGGTSKNLSPEYMQALQGQLNGVTQSVKTSQPQATQWGAFNPPTATDNRYVPQTGTVPSAAENFNSPYTKSVSASQPVGTPNQMGLQQLTTPSMQYYSNMTPTEQGLYSGYQQALTGDSEEDTQYKLWNRAAPSGSSTLSYNR